MALRMVRANGQHLLDAFNKTRRVLLAHGKRGTKSRNLNCAAAILPEKFRVLILRREPLERRHIGRCDCSAQNLRHIGSQPFASVSYLRKDLFRKAFLERRRWNE